MKYSRQDRYRDIRALASARGSVAHGPKTAHRGPKDKGHSHSRARRAREWQKHASPRARRARGRAKLSARFRRLPVLLYVFHDSAKNRDFHGTI